MKKIEMKLCPNIKMLDDVAPVVIETKEGGIQTFCHNDRLNKIVLQDYALLKGSFDEKVRQLEKLKKDGKMFFSIYAPSARFILVDE